MEIGNTIKNLRRSKRIKQRLLAKVAGITPGYLSQIENGYCTPSIKVMKSIAKNLGTSAPIVIALSITKFDIEEDQEDIFNILYPHIKNMLMQIVKDTLL